MPRIGGVLFDKDGTLLDFGSTWTTIFDRTLERLQPDPAARRAMALAVGYEQGTGRFVPGSPIVTGHTTETAAIWAEWLPGRSADDVAAEIDAGSVAGLHTADLVPAVADLAGLLDGLAADGRHLGIATHDAEEATRDQVAALGVAGHFAFIAGYDSGWGTKPGPGMVLAFCEACGVESHRVLMVGDSVSDLKAGRAAGAAVIGVLTGPATADDLEPHANRVVPSIGDLPAVIAAIEAESDIR